MNKTVLSYFLDGVSVAFISFFIAYGLSVFYMRKEFPSVILGVCASAITVSVYLLVCRKTRKKVSVKKGEQKEYENFLTTLRFSKDEEISRLIESLPAYKDFSVKFKFGFSATTADDLLFAYKSVNEKEKLAFFSIEFTPEALKLAKETGEKIKLVSGEELYKALKEIEKLPKPLTVNSEKNYKFLTLLKSTFQKKKVGTIAFYGATLLVLSRFVFYPLFYIVTGTAFLLYALTIKFFAPK